MLDVRERLASHLYRSGIDTESGAVPALRIDYNNTLPWKDVGLKWAIDGLNLILFPGASFERSYPLDGTLGDLVARLSADGFEVELLDPDLATASAGILINPTREETLGAERPIHAFGSDLWGLLDAFGVALNTADANMQQALLQIVLTTATGEILDYWGEFFNVFRQDESDDVFRARIIAEATRLRSNGFAIQNTIKAETGFDVSIREPWRELFALDFSALSDAESFQDGSFYTWNVLQPVYHSNLTLAERATVIEIINRNRAAGCVLLGEAAQPAISYGRRTAARTVSTQNSLIHSLGLLNYRGDVLSSSLGLSDYAADVAAPFKWTTNGNVVQTFGTDGVFFSDPRRWTGGWDDTVWFKGSFSLVVTRHSA